VSHRISSAGLQEGLAGVRSSLRASPPAAPGRPTFRPAAGVGSKRIAGSTGAVGGSRAAPAVEPHADCPNGGVTTDRSPTFPAPVATPCAPVRPGPLPPSTGLRQLRDALATSPQRAPTSIWICGEKFSRLARDDIGFGGAGNAGALAGPAQAAQQNNWSNSRTPVRGPSSITGLFVERRVDLPIPSQ
jgi:hypothetical protein